VFSTAAIADLLVEEGYAEEHAPEGLEDRECRDCLQRSAHTLLDQTSVVLTFSAFPLTPTSVPRRVYNVCDAERDAERREYGAPIISNCAS